MARNPEIWRRLFAREHPKCNYDDEINDWHKAFKLHATRILDRFQCFHSKRNMFQEVIGMPLEVSVHPMHQRIDYISSTMDTLSHESFKAGVRRNRFGVSFHHWLPLYLTPAHFARSSNLTEKSVEKLVASYGRGDRGGRYPRRVERFRPEMVLDVFPKLMITFAVLLADKGIETCNKALNGFQQVHRLFLAMVQRYPELRVKINAKLRVFCCGGEDHRHKKRMRSLGDILPLLAVSDRYSWDNIWQVFLAETFDRAVLWLCKEHPELANLPTKDDRADPAKLRELREKRLELTLDAIAVRLRITMFFVFFFKTFCRGTLAARAERYDRYFGDAVPHGMPSLRQFEERVKGILEIKSWPDVFKNLGVQCPPKETVARILEESVANSLRRGYHKKGMDFRRIQKRGVSTTLIAEIPYLTQRRRDERPERCHVWNGPGKNLCQPEFPGSQTSRHGLLHVHLDRRRDI